MTARREESDEYTLSSLLTVPQRRLFERMARHDQRHALNVCATLRQVGYDDPDLLAAALLHDVGKAAGRIWLWQRVLTVLLNRWVPRLSDWLTRERYLLSDSDLVEDGELSKALIIVRQTPRWRRGLMINRLHSEIGAQWAAEVGCSPVTVALVRRHQELVQDIKYKDRLLVALQWADGVN